MGPIYHLLGLTVGCLQHDAAFLYDPELTDVGRGGYQYLVPVSRAEAYRADILYGTNNEFGFDYLRDNMAVNAELQVQTRAADRPAHHFAIVDEVDNILIDEARTPLIISGPAQQPVEHYSNCARLAPRLREYEDYTVDERTQAISLTEDGIGRAERHMRYVENAVVAQVQKVKDKDYVISDGEVVIVDEFTGRLQYGRRWSDGLHQAVEAKEGVKVQRESVTYATITLQNYFRMYHKLSGMTGTAVTEADEFYKIYGLEVVAVPTNVPMVRDDSSDSDLPHCGRQVAGGDRQHRPTVGSGQPVLVGNESSIETRNPSAIACAVGGVRHKVLNARNHEQERPSSPRPVAPARSPCLPTWPGRGTDIVLGGADTDRQDWQEEHNRVITLGGLHVIGTEHHEARRVDNQLRGSRRAPGRSRQQPVFRRLEDELMQRFGGDRIKNVMNWTGLNDDEPLENKLITKSISSAQVKQRSVIYEQRSRILASLGLRERILDMLGAEFDRLVSAHLQARHADDWDADGFVGALRQICPPPDELDTPEKVLALRRDHIEEILDGYAETLYEAKERTLGPEDMETLVRLLLLKSIDTHWVNHLTHMENLRTGVGLQAVGQRDPLTVYRSEGQRAFTELTRQMQREVTHTLFHVTLAPEAPTTRAQANGSARAPVSPMAAVSPGRSTPAPRAGRKIGRNSQCPCGSGKKFKRCCGAAA
ncbi:Protein translocase subunit SecA [Geodia barretti]|uniref:Protein translocase subunit SecA n=1 Tax=Geodia barretti TaxID=519541 RepID=A0AA35RDW0_GEOBA|nr:Protein translocase subunit SecA [Geodia barretti]